MAEESGLSLPAEDRPSHRHQFGSDALFAATAIVPHQRVRRRISSQQIRYRHYGIFWSLVAENAIDALDVGGLRQQNRELLFVLWEFDRNAEAFKVLCLHNMVRVPAPVVPVDGGKTGQRFIGRQELIARRE